jgi:hypothetical protein
MTSPLVILGDAIADVGSWRWWEERLPDVFQLEFGGVQLWSAPVAAGKPPNGQYALRFRRPVSVSFLTARDAGVPADWANRLHVDKLRPFNVGHDSFVLEDRDAARAILASAARVDTRYGALPAHLDWARAPVVCAFWAGPVGCLVAARAVELIGLAGEIPLTDVPGMAQRWWEYWREYWRRKDGPEALPQDYACEVTIPIKQ